MVTTEEIKQMLELYNKHISTDKKNKKTIDSLNIKLKQFFDYGYFRVRKWGRNVLSWFNKLFIAIYSTYGYWFNV